MMKQIKASSQGLFGAEFILSEAEGRLRVTCFRMGRLFEGTPYELRNNMSEVVS
jgi:hypothetical protein